MATILRVSKYNSVIIIIYKSFNGIIITIYK